MYVFLSCQRKYTEIENNEALYAIDTVKIDSKGHLLDLNRFILISDLDDEEKSLFLYNAFDHSIDEINLDRLDFANKYFFEKEGPNGTGESFYSLNHLKGGFFFIKSYNKSAIFDKNGVLVKRVDWVNSIDSIGSIYGQQPENEILISSSDLKVFGLDFDDKNRKIHFDILSIVDNSIKRLDLDSEKSYGCFVLEGEDSQGHFFVKPHVYLSSENNLAIISHDFSNELILYDSVGEFVKKINYESRFTPSSAKSINGKTITSREHAGKEFQYFLEQVRFYPPVWDNVKKRYLRLSKITVFSDDRINGSFLPEVLKTSVFLSVFDSDFTLIYELAIPGLNYNFGKYFSKDGKFWIYQNFSDDLGFVIIEIKDLN
ncbi:protein of unknown function [Algoriphagus boritolerans DSM 17298 = JCM 18970]|uniref:TolB-like 6-blade propeller-like n=3 Tax=Algoriphagus TaxID=246875 RepID=A0A1H5YGF5_9BACT|nr:protein of unknown function [Algoriphagus boritolerans DSM 17298 = JCM 18970]